MVREFKQDGKDVLYGMDRALSGMSLGAYDWLKRKTGLGFDEQAYMAEKEKQGSDIGAKIGGVISEIGGGMIGGGRGIVNGLSKLGLKGVKLGAGAGATEGLATGLTSSDTLEELPLNLFYSTAAGGVLGGAGDAVMNWGGKVLKPYIKAPKEASPKQFQRYVSNNADKEVMEFVPSREYLKNYPAGSSFNPNKYTKEQAEKVLREQADKAGLRIYNDGLEGERVGINHFLGSDRRAFVRTTDQTYFDPDVKFIWDGNEHYVKKYRNNNTQKDKHDLVITKKGQLFTKFPTKPRALYNKISGAQDLSLKAPSSITFKPISGVIDTSYINIKNPVVNPELKNFTYLYDGLDSQQGEFLTNAINQAGKKKHS